MQKLKNIYKSGTFRLRKYPPTVLDGVVEILSFSAEIINKYNTNSTDNEADFNSLQADWKAVGNDMYHSLELYARRKTAK
jgi:hypothetical protein